MNKNSIRLVAKSDHCKSDAANRDSFQILVP